MPEVSIMRQFRGSGQTLGRLGQGCVVSSQIAQHAVAIVPYAMDRRSSWVTLETVIFYLRFSPGWVVLSDAHEFLRTRVP